LPQLPVANPGKSFLKKNPSLGQRTKSEAARWPSLLTFEQDSGTADNQTGFNDDSVQAPNGNKFAALRPFKEGRACGRVA